MPAITTISKNQRLFRPSLDKKSSDNPIFYCHHQDLGHEPVLTIEICDDLVKVYCHTTFKIKANPQNKVRVDIYLSILQTYNLASFLETVGTSGLAGNWKGSDHDPGSARNGRIELPVILDSYYGNVNLVRVRTNSGYVNEKINPRVYIELEEPHGSHIKMSDREFHVGIPLSDARQNHISGKNTWPVNVPEDELQKWTNEANPINKTTGTMYLEVSLSQASTLGKTLLESIRKNKLL